MDAISELAPYLEVAQSAGDTSYAKLLDVCHGLDALPHATILGPLQAVKVAGTIYAFIAAFLRDWYSVV